jgi:hypothetical protein
MTGIIFCVLALFGCFLVARRSFVDGIIAVLTVGYLYGILRANFFETASHFVFDAAVLGFYCARLQDLLRKSFTVDGQRLRHWVNFLMLLPLAFFFVPLQDPLVQLVGLRGNAFLLPFIVVGARLKRDEFYRIALALAGLNIFALVVGAAEYVFGVERFLPHNTVTALIYRSNDVGAMNYLRIPSVFGSAHVYGGTMVLSLPLLAYAWVQRRREIWHKNLLIAGIVAGMLGVFLCAARSQFVALAIVITVATFSTRLRPVYRIGWVAVLLVVAFVVSTHPRMQRFMTLGDREFVAERFQSSVNTTLLDAISQYPFGLGLGGGGTSIPFFLSDRVNTPVAVESEWGRIVLETGLVGLAAWAAFLLWVFTRPHARKNDVAFLGYRLAWYVALTFFASGFIGIGLFTSIPSTSILLMIVGWIATHHTGEADAPITAVQARFVPIPYREPEFVQR